MAGGQSGQSGHTVASSFWQNRRCRRAAALLLAFPVLGSHLFQFFESEFSRKNKRTSVFLKNSGRFRKEVWSEFRLKKQMTSPKNTVHTMRLWMKTISKWKTLSVCFLRIQKYSRLRCLLPVKGLVFCFYLGWSGSILQFRQNIIKVGSKSNGFLLV